MKCPFCGAEDTQVIDSRVSEEGDSIRRRRRCQVCNKRFTTYETAELRMPQIVKADGVREDFSSPKLRTASSAPCTSVPSPPSSSTPRSSASSRSCSRSASARSIRGASARW